MIMPGVQNPHCRPCSSQNAFLDRVQLAVLGQPFDRLDVGAVGLDRQDGAGLDGRPSTMTVQAPHWLVSQPTCVPVRPSCSRRKCTSSVRGSTSPVTLLAVDRHR